MRIRKMEHVPASVYENQLANKKKELVDLIEEIEFQEDIETLKEVVNAMLLAQKHYYDKVLLNNEDLYKCS